MQNRNIDLEKRQFRSTDMQITPVGFGAWALGGEIGFIAGDHKMMRNLSRRFIAHWIWYQLD